MGLQYLLITISLILLYIDKTRKKQRKTDFGRFYTPKKRNILTFRRIQRTIKFYISKLHSNR